VAIDDLVSTMPALIDDFERLRPSLEQRARAGDRVPLERVKLRSPLPRPSKVICCIANYWEHAQRAPRPLNMFLKNPDAVIGPCIATADEFPGPNGLSLWVQCWNDGQLRHNYSTDDMEHPVPELIEFASRGLTLRSGDLIACGTNHEGLGPVQDGETLEMEI